MQPPKFMKYRRKLKAEQRKNLQQSQNNRAQQEAKKHLQSLSSSQQQTKNWEPEDLFDNNYVNSSLFVHNSERKKGTKIRRKSVLHDYIYSKKQQKQPNLRKTECLWKKQTRSITRMNISADILDNKQSQKQNKIQNKNFKLKMNSNLLLSTKKLGKNTKVKSISLKKYSLTQPDQIKKYSSHQKMYYFNDTIQKSRWKILQTHSNTEKTLSKNVVHEGQQTTRENKHLSLRPQFLKLIEKIKSLQYHQMNPKNLCVSSTKDSKLH